MSGQDLISKSIVIREVSSKIRSKLEGRYMEEMFG